MDVDGPIDDQRMLMDPLTTRGCSWTSMDPLTITEDVLGCSQRKDLHHYVVVSDRGPTKANNQASSLMKLFSRHHWSIVLLPPTDITFTDTKLPGCCSKTNLFSNLDSLQFEFVTEAHPGRVI